MSSKQTTAQNQGLSQHTTQVDRPTVPPVSSDHPHSQPTGPDTLKELHAIATGPRPEMQMGCDCTITLEAEFVVQPPPVAESPESHCKAHSTIVSITLCYNAENLLHLGIEQWLGCGLACGS